MASTTHAGRAALGDDGGTRRYHPVRRTCVPPHNSRDEPMSMTRTSSPYFSPKSIIAPVSALLADRHYAVLAIDVLGDLGIDDLLDAPDFLVGQRLVMHEVESASCRDRPARPFC